MIFIGYYPISSCKCNQYGFCGNACSLEDPCVENPCANGGVCIEKCTETADYYCNCTDQYTGKNCTEEVSIFFNNISIHINWI